MILNCQVFSQHVFCTRNKSILTCKNNISLFQLSFYKSCLLQVDRVVFIRYEITWWCSCMKMHLYSNVDITNRRIIGELKIILMYIWKLNDKNMIILTEMSTSRLLKPMICKNWNIVSIFYDECNCSSFLILKIQISNSLLWMFRFLRRYIFLKSIIWRLISHIIHLFILS